MQALDSRFQKRENGLENPDQSGINMVDLMMWLVIAALLLAAAIQGIGYYQKATYLYHMKSDLSGAGANVVALTPENDGRIDRDVTEKGTADSKWSANISYTVEVPDGKTVPYIRASHPEIDDSDAIYLFETCGPEYPIGVSIIPKGLTPALEACGVTNTPPDGGDTTIVEGGGDTIILNTYLEQNDQWENVPLTNPAASFKIEAPLSDDDSFGLFALADDSGNKLSATHPVATWTATSSAPLPGELWDDATEDFSPVNLISTQVKFTADRTNKVFTAEYIGNSLSTVDQSRLTQWIEDGFNDRDLSPFVYGGSNWLIKTPPSEW